MKNSKLKTKNNQQGIALLPMLLVILTLVVVVGIAISGISVSENTISKTSIDSDISFAIAEAGIEDALMQIVRDKNFTSAGYSLSVSSGTATIIVSGTTTKTISSTGTINNKSRKIVVVADVDANGRVTQTSWAETAP